MSAARRLDIAADSAADNLVAPAADSEADPLPLADGPTLGDALDMVDPLPPILLTMAPEIATLSVVRHVPRDYFPELQLQCAAVILRAVRWRHAAALLTCGAAALPLVPHALPMRRLLAAELDLALRLLPRTIFIRWEHDNLQHRMVLFCLARRADDAGTSFATQIGPELVVSYALALLQSDRPQPRYLYRAGYERAGDGTRRQVAPLERPVVAGMRQIASQAIRVTIQVLAPTRATRYRYLVEPSSIEREHEDRRTRAQRGGAPPLHARNPEWRVMRRWALVEILALCSPMQRRVLALRLRGHGFAAIGQRLGIDEATARRHHHRLVLKARRLFADGEDWRDLFHAVADHTEMTIGSDGRPWRYPPRRGRRVRRYLWVETQGGVAARDRTLAGGNAERFDLMPGDGDPHAGWDIHPACWGSYRRKGTSYSWRKDPRTEDEAWQDRGDRAHSRG